MEVVRNTQVPGGRIRLLKLKNQHKDLSSNQYMYVVEFPDGDRTAPRFTKMAGLKEHRRVVNNRKAPGSGDMGGLLSGNIEDDFR